MKQYTVKKAFNYKRFGEILFFILISIAIGFSIAYWGNGTSFVEDKTSFITIIVTLFGLGLTSAIFVAQTLDNIEWNEVKQKKADRLKVSLAKSLGLIALLILISIILEFILSIIPIYENVPNIFRLIINSAIYAIFSYIIILQTDVTICFLQIMKLKKKD